MVPTRAWRSVARVSALESPVLRALARAAMALAVCIGLLAGSAARGAGPVVGWGSGAPPPMISASAIAVGGSHNCAIQSGTGAVVCWGRNPYYDDGQATPPASVDGTAGSATAIAAGESHSCALQAGSGAVVCWGDNSYGEATPPASVNGTAGTAARIAVGQAFHSCAIQAGSGAVVCWGANFYGQATRRRPQ